MVLKVLNKNWELSEFSIDKIIKTIKEETNLHEFNPGIIYTLSHAIFNHIQSLQNPGGVIYSEVVRGIISQHLYEASYQEQAILLRDCSISTGKCKNIDRGTIHSDNANQLQNSETAHKIKADTISKQANLNLLPQHLRKAHTTGILHIHDLEYFGSRPFCCEHDLRYIYKYGFYPDGVGLQTSVSRPAQKPEVAVLQATKLLESAQSNFSGGQGLLHGIVFMSPYFEGLSDEKIEQLAQMFIYELNQTLSARGGQTVFSTLQMAPGVPKTLQNSPIVYQGYVYDGIEKPLKTYGELDETVEKMFKAFIDVAKKGDMLGKPFPFPKFEVNVYPEMIEKPKKLELYKLANELSCTKGSIYWENHYPEFKQTDGVSCTSCCAYSFKMDKDDNNFDKKLNFIDGHHFSLGSAQVITINMPRIAMEYKLNDQKDATHNRQIEVVKFKIEKVMELATQILVEKRKVLHELLTKNRVPFAQQTPKDPLNKEKTAPPLVDFDDYVYTIGFVGLSEYGEIIYDKDMRTQSLRRSLLATIMSMQDIIQKLSKKYHIKLALARTPAETTAQRFAVMDLKYFGHNIEPYIQGNLGKAKRILKDKPYTTDLPIYYTNGAFVPDKLNMSIVDKIRYESPYFIALEGGNVFHLYIGEGQPEPSGLWEILLNIFKNSQISYIDVTRDFTVCVDCMEYSYGLHNHCPKCNSTRVDYISRITGYLSSVSSWNEAKKEELKRRVKYDVGNVI